MSAALLPSDATKAELHRRNSASFRYYVQIRAAVVVEGATVRPFLTETATMIFIGILAGIAAIGVLCWLLFTLGVFALPVFAAPPLAIGLIRPAQAGPAGSSSALSPPR